MFRVPYLENQCLKLLLSIIAHLIHYFQVINSIIFLDQQADKFSTTQISKFISDSQCRIKYRQDLPNDQTHHPIGYQRTLC